MFRLNLARVKKNVNINICREKIKTKIPPRWERGGIKKSCIFRITIYLNSNTIHQEQDVHLKNQTQ